MPDFFLALLKITGSLLCLNIKEGLDLIGGIGSEVVVARLREGLI